MTLDPQAQQIVDIFRAAGGRRLEEMSPSMARFMFDSKVAKINLPPAEVAAVEPIEIPGGAGPIPARLYRPAEAAAGPLPVLGFFHGGGYVIGSLNSHDPQCRYLCNAARCLVVSVGYRKAPEHKFPAAVDDAVAASRWLAANAAALGGDGARFALFGDSAGGNLVAVACQAALDAGGPAIRLQAMVYPNLDLFAELPSHALFDEDLLLTRDLVDWFVAQYLGDAAARTDPRFAPLRRPDLAGLPPALIITGEYDPLRDEGAAYAERLSQAGVAVDYLCYTGQVHNFLLWGGMVDAARQALDQAAAALTRAFAA